MSGCRSEVELAGRLYRFRGDALEAVEVLTDVPRGHLWLSVADAARWIGMGKRNLWVCIYRGELRCRRTAQHNGRLPTTFVSVVELEAWNRYRRKNILCQRHWHFDEPRRKPHATPAGAAKSHATPKQKPPQRKKRRGTRPRNTTGEGPGA